VLDGGLTMSDELWRWGAVELSREIRLGKVSSHEAVRSVLDRLEKVNPRLNAVTVVLADQALAAAHRADSALARGEALGPLHGVPVTVKENVDQVDCATANGVVAFRDVVASADSPPVANWKRAGAVVIGRTNTPAFSVRWHTDNDLRGCTINPWDGTRTPGGSSGGAAAALATGIAPLAHGNDYGGSIRYPAYCCGVAGIRPTLGRVPGYNATAPGERPPTAQLMAVNGPMARRVRDLRLGLGAMAAADPRDPWWVPAPLQGPAVARPIRVALCVDPAGRGVHPDVAAAVGAAGRALQDEGYTVEAVEPPGIGTITELWARLVVADIRHAMLPLIRQLGDKDVNRALDLMLEATPEIDLPTYVRESAERARHLREWMLFLERYPLVVGPVSTEPPFPVGFDLIDAAGTARVLTHQRLLVTVNFLGLPAVAVPSGLAGQVPVGVQVIGGRYREDLCLDAAEVIEARCGALTPIDPR
jgi:amidase